MASGTSVRAIARVVRVSEAALYRHFPSKQAIFDEVLQRADGGLLASQLSGMDAALADRDPPTFLRATAEVLLRGWDQPPARQIASVVARALGEAHADIITEDWRVEANWATVRPLDRSGAHRSGKGHQSTGADELAPSAYVRLLYLHAEANAAIRLAVATLCCSSGVLHRHRIQRHAR